MTYLEEDNGLILTISVAWEKRDFGNPLVASIRERRM